MDSRPKQGKSQHNKCLQRSTIYKVLLYLTDLVRSYVRQHSDHSACQSLNKSDSRNLERSLNAVPWLRRLGLHGSDSIREPLLWVSDFSDFKSRWSYLRRFKTPFEKVVLPDFASLYLGPGPYKGGTIISKSTVINRVQSFECLHCTISPAGTVGQNTHVGNLAYQTANQPKT